MITGIDISEKNGPINLDKGVENDINFAYIKASEALNSADSCFRNNMSEAREKGLLVGAYHWLHPRLHVGQQARFFIDIVGNFIGMLPPVVCLNTHRAPIDQIEMNIKKFIEILEKSTGVKPVIFTSIAYWEKYLSTAEWAGNYPLWLDLPGGNLPPQIFPWAGWTFWQYTYQASLPGVPAAIGLNLFNGNKEELEKMVIE